MKAAAKELVRGPRVLSARGTDDDDEPAFVVRDRNYARELLAMMNEN